MGLQIILWMETNNNSRTDWVYIKETINKYYISSNEIKITPRFLEGKGNYKAARTIKQIKTLTKEYSKTGETIVIYCIDTDNIQVDQDQKREFYEIKDYCISKGYEFVWFCRDVEEVYWGKRIANSEKVIASSRFRSSNQLKKVDEKSLSSSRILVKRSNLLSILDKYLKRG